MSIQKENTNLTLEQTLQAIKVWRVLFENYQEEDIVQVKRTGRLGKIRGTSTGWEPVLYALEGIDTEKFIGWFPAKDLKFIRISDEKLESLQNKIS